MKEGLKKLFQNKAFRVCFICIVALLLLVAVWKVFFSSGKEKTASGSYQPTELESRLSQILSEIDGVGQTTVMIGEENGAPVSAIVVFKGEDGILTRMRIIEAAASALNISPNEVLVYPSE